LCDTVCQGNDIEFYFFQTGWIWSVIYVKMRIGSDL
jgi:hypothetical protein